MKVGFEIQNSFDYIRYNVNQIEAFLSSLGASDSFKSSTDAATVRASIKGWKENVLSQRDYNFTLILKYDSGWGASLEEFECVDAERIL